MTIKNGKRGDIVYLGNGYGPKARIAKKDRSTRYTPKPWQTRGIYYAVVILESRTGFKNMPGDTRNIQAKFLSRTKKESRKRMET